MADEAHELRARARARAARRAANSRVVRRARRSSAARLLADLGAEQRAGLAGSSRAGSGDDTDLPADEHAVDLEVVVEHDDVCGPPDVEPADVGWPITRAGTARRRVDRVARAGRRARGGCAPPRSSSATLPASTPSGPRATPSRTSTSSPPRLYDPSPRPAPAIASVTSATRPRGRPPDEPHRVGGEVDAVDDHLDDHVVAGERRTGDARIAVVERAHRVEEVRDGAHAAVEGGVRLLRGRVRVTAGDGRRRRAGARRSARRRRAARARASSSRTGPAASSRSSSAGSGSRREAGRMRAEPARRRGTGPRDGRRGSAARCGSSGTSRSAATSSLLGRGDERRQVARSRRSRAAPRRRVAVALRVRFEEVDAAEPVHLEVDEARARRCPRPFSDASPTRDDPAVDDLDVARDELAVDERCFDAEPHSSSAIRTSPPAASSRARAVVGVDACEERDDRDLRIAVGGVERGVDLVGRAPVASRTIRRTARGASSFVATTSTIRLPNVFPSRTIAIVEIMLSTSFCAVPGLEPGRAGDHLGADDDGDLVLGRAPSSESATRDDRDRQRAGVGRASSAPTRTAFARWR